MTIAKVFNGRTILVTQTVRRTDNGRLIHYSQDPTWGERAVAYVDNRASKPVPLTDTYMEIDRSYRNVAIYTRVAPPFIWQGTAGFVYPATGVTDVQSSHGDVDALRRRSLSNLATGNVNAGQTLGELPSTCRMIANRLGRISSAAHALAIGNSLAVAKSLGVQETKKLRQLASVPPPRRLADGWLELQYGWKPILSDIYGALEAHRNGLKEKGAEIKSHTRVGNSTRRPVRGEASGGTLSSPEALGALSRRASTTGTVSNPSVRSLNELGLLNPLSLAWELLPYSFVVDWALPIGEILNGLYATAGLTGVRTTVVTERRSTTRLVPSNIWTQVDQNIRRSPFSEGAPFDVSLSLVKLTGPSSVVLANATALLAQSFNRNRVSIL